MRSIDINNELYPRVDDMAVGQPTQQGYLNRPRTSSILSASLGIGRDTLYLRPWEQQIADELDLVNAPSELKTNQNAIVQKFRDALSRLRIPEEVILEAREEARSWCIRNWSFLNGGQRPMREALQTQVSHGDQGESVGGSYPIKSEFAA